MPHTHASDGSLGSVEIRPVASSDLPTLYAMQREPAGNSMAVANPRSREDFDSHWRSILDDSDVTARVILSGGAVVGYISCFKMDGEDAVGYWVTESHWGKGVATEALQMLLAEVATRPLLARVARSNVASIRVLEKCGFGVVEHRWSVATSRFPACEEAIMRLA